MTATVQPLMSFIDLVFTLCAYIIGSIAFAVMISKLMGIKDPRQYGSGNPGATNVLRSGNKLAAALTLLGDGLKGLVAVLLARGLGPHFGLDEAGIAWVALAVVVGHMWPLFLGFKGGKGVATAIGVLFGLNVFVGLATVATWLVVAAIWRYSSLAAMVALVLSPIYGYMLMPHGTPELGITMVIALLVFYRHRTNLVKLLTHQEKKIGEQSKAPADPNS